MGVEGDGRTAAERFRSDHGLGCHPLGDLIALIEQATMADVAVLDAGPDEHGLTMRDPRRDVVFIGVARTRNPMRQRSTLAHELGHVIFADWADPEAGSWSVRCPGEIRADAFARHLLVPTEGVCGLLGHPGSVTEAALSVVVQRFLVSPAMAAIALCQAGYIDAETKQSWLALSTRQLAVRYGWSDQYRALQTEADQRRAPQRLLARAIRGYVDGVLSAQAIATLRGVAVSVVEEDLRQAGIAPAPRPVPWAEAGELPELSIDWATLDTDLGTSTVDEQSAAQPQDS